jgi:hypothetical protein
VLVGGTLVGVRGRTVSTGGPAVLPAGTVALGRAGVLVAGVAVETFVGALAVLVCIVCEAVVAAGFNVRWIGAIVAGV